MMILSRETKKHVTVALSGDGGDELFWGYNNYFRMAKVRKLYELPKFIRSSVSFLLNKSLNYRMKKIADGLNIAGDEEVYLKPSGFHIMFIGLKEPIVKGKMYKGTLNFKNAGSVTVNFKAVDRGYHPDKDHHKHH